MRGSLVKLLVKPGFMTGSKKTSLLAFMPPSATPVVLLKLRMRPFSATMNWLGPAAPMVSGGKEFSVSARVAPVKFRPTVCGVLGERGAPFVSGGQIGVSGDSGLLARF